MNARILIVEDEVVTRQTLTRLFQQEGYEVFDHYAKATTLG